MKAKGIGSIVCAAVVGMYAFGLIRSNIELNNSPELRSLRTRFQAEVAKGPDSSWTIGNSEVKKTKLSFGGRLDSILAERNRYLRWSNAEPFIPLEWDASQGYKSRDSIINKSGDCVVLTFNPFWEYKTPSKN